jgi:hypothetical protein
MIPYNGMAWDTLRVYASAKPKIPYLTLSGLFKLEFSGNFTNADQGTTSQPKVT